MNESKWVYCLTLAFWFVTYIPIIAITDFYIGTVLSVITTIGTSIFFKNFFKTLKKTEC